MAIGRVVPWSCWQEWIQAYADLFSESSGRRQQALTQVELPQTTGMQSPHLAYDLPMQPPEHCSSHIFHASAQLSAWRSRGKVPLGVDITALLVEAQLRSVCPGELCLGSHHSRQCLHVSHAVKDALLPCPPACSPSSAEGTITGA